MTEAHTFDKMLAFGHALRSANPQIIVAVKGSC